MIISLLNLSQNACAPELHNTPKNIKKTTIVANKRNTSVYPIAIWHLVISLKGM